MVLRTSRINHVTFKTAGTYLAHGVIVMMERRHRVVINVAREETIWFELGSWYVGLSSSVVAAHSLVPAAGTSSSSGLAPHTQHSLRVV